MPAMIAARVLACLLLVGCTPPTERTDQHGGNEAPTLRPLLLSRLTTIVVSDTSARSDLDEQRVEWRSDSSDVVPGLRYTWATYQPANSPHVRYSVVGGELESRVSLLEGPAAWSSLTRFWSPATAHDARQACFEIARAVAPVARSGQLAIPLEQAREEVRALPPRLRSIAAAAMNEASTESVAPHLGGSRLAARWLFEDRRSTRYRCTFPDRAAGDSAGVILDILQVIEGVGWYTPERRSTDSG